jgi:iron(III) transport system permease protein
LTAATRNRLGALVIAALLVWLVGYPLLLTFVQALEVDGNASLAPLASFAGAADEWAALGRSLLVASASVVLAALVGVPLAFVFARTDFPGRRILGALVALPVALPPLVGVIAFLFLYGESGFVPRLLVRLLDLEKPPWRLHGLGAILLVHTYSMYVYFYLFTRAALARLDGASLEAAASLGAGHWRTLWRVTIPQLYPALLGAALLTFMTALGSFSAPYIFAGGYRVMTTQIVASKVSGDITRANLESVALAVLALIALFVVRALQASMTDATSAHGVAPRPRRIVHPGVRRAFTVLGWLLALLLLLPHLTLMLISLVPSGTWTTELMPPVLDFNNYRLLISEPERLRPMVNSLWMATVATFGAVALGLVAARRARAVRGRTGDALEALVALPWAIPGTVFAIALAATFSVSQPWFGRFLWVGTPIILPLAYLVRVLPITGRAAIAGLRQLDPALEEAAWSLGANRARSFFRVVLPLIRPVLAAAIGLSFITALGDFVVSIVLYTYETRPISIEILSTLRSQSFGVAAAYGVMLMLLSAAAFLVWGRGEAAS